MLGTALQKVWLEWEVSATPGFESVPCEDPGDPWRCTSLRTQTPHRIAADFPEMVSNPLSVFSQSQMQFPLTSPGSWFSEKFGAHWDEEFCLHLHLHECLIEYLEVTQEQGQVLLMWLCGHWGTFNILGTYGQVPERAQLLGQSKAAQLIFKCPLGHVPALQGPLIRCCQRHWDEIL